ncbi:MAG: toll/interleukin-1 receptor domain-containing protein [Paludibacteraceae bacterium]|nr:toll/interleukin-1 receptor domain-containing protein [Paludibacteraceae bacterium]
MAEKRFGLESLLGKANIKPAETDAALSWDKLADDCIAGNYVLIVGPDAMLNIESEELQNAHGNSDTLVRNLMNEYRSQLDGTEYYRRGQTIYEDICDTLHLIRNEIKVTDMEPSLRSLVQTKCFPIVVTTTYDPYMEYLMREVWGERLLVKNIYATGSERDITMVVSEYKTLEPTLYYAFGRAEFERRENNVVRRPFTITDNDKLLIVDQWLKYPPKNIKQRLSEKRTLAIGCKYDDWLFRMLWYIWRGSVKDLNGGEVIMDFATHDASEDKQLKNYLKTEKISFFDNARLFMKDLSAKISERYCAQKQMIREQDIAVKDRWENDGIFLSYASEDFVIVKKIYEKLCGAGFNVWMDVRLQGGDEYDRRINSAINSCKLFVPVISRQTEMILQNEEGINRYFYKDEWLVAEGRIEKENNLGERTMRVLPLLTDKVDINRTDASFPGFITKTECFDLTANNIEILIDNIKKLL